ncbi:MAG: A/G-specific adenine glycosylase [Promethearchaeota archaeon]|nr:MAG: A/G-specific adenine glycosylase [Candidatus Lokiarchaeota archaeon]
MNSKVIQAFQDIIYSYYKQHYRDFPFRKNMNPYKVLVSEIMLQQTQTSRVSEKYVEFLNIFPDIKALSESSVDEVLKTWQGLGYNRRAIALKKIADIVMKEHEGKIPKSIEILKSFPQIGHNTACSIYTFAYNKPSYFIETNIRNVYIYFFFPKKQSIKDNDILLIVKKTVDEKNPREWYYALMDYGVMLKKTLPELNKRSAHYRKQKPFKGSNRQLRGKILKLLIKKPELKLMDLQNELKIEQKKLNKILKQLSKEGFIYIKNDRVILNQE